MSYRRVFVALLLGAGTLLAQEDAEVILQASKNVPSTPAAFTHTALGLTKGPMPAASAQPSFVNVLTVVGTNGVNPGVPCFNCVTGATASNIGLIAPTPNVLADGSTSYALDNFVYNNSYSGNCNFTFLVRDEAKNYIVKSGPISIPLSPGGNLLGTAVTFPNSAAAAGQGLVITLVQCGSTSATSYMPVYITHP